MKWFLYHSVTFLLLAAKIDCGIFSSFIYSDRLKCDHDGRLNLDVSSIKVFFYDFVNDYNVTSVIGSAAEKITSSKNKIKLNMSKKLVIFVPGYKSHINKKTAEHVRQTFKDVSDVYLIIIDHSEYTHNQGGKLKSYERSVFYTYYIAQAVANFLVGMHKGGYPSKNIHAVGHSIGSQIWGYAGAAYMNETNEKIWRITGLDPAGPCFSNSAFENQIRSGVAEYVEVYHCNAGGLGTTSRLADADFFMNSGEKQPHCSGTWIPAVGESDQARCSHIACVTYWLKTVHSLDSYLAWECASYKEFRDGACAAHEVAIAGYGNPGNATGVFYASTE